MVGHQDLLLDQVAAREAIPPDRQAELRRNSLQQWDAMDREPVAAVTLNAAEADDRSVGLADAVAEVAEHERAPERAGRAATSRP
ncbi:MAG: hypothetical protein U0790_16790 [Isosphaeraceae bacterium]